MHDLPKVVVGALVEKDGKFLLTKEILESSEEYWIIPGGKVEFGETLEDAARREIKEELGIDVSINNLIGFKEAIYTKHGYHTIIFFFSASPINNSMTFNEVVLDAKYFSKEEIKDLNLVESAKWVLNKIGVLL